MIALLLGYLCFNRSQTLELGRQPHFELETFQRGLAIGQRGTQLAQVLKGTCALRAPSFTVAASTTVAMDCAVTGVLSSDTVFAQFATSSVVGNGWLISGANASSTSGFITMRVENRVGASAVIPASVASTTKYLILR